jgi:aspartyl-tRNA(Asn)/glutamyl-tRNA(Gln) amidotransferase subunit C
MLAFRMADRLTKADVVRIASLAQLQLTDDEQDRLTRQLADILDYVNEISAIDTTSVAPTAYVMITAASDRSDEVAPSLPPSEALANAPEAALERGLFKVPRVIG